MRYGRFKRFIGILALGAALGTPAASAQESAFQEACRTFEGRYEERREGCDPDCTVTYICHFDDGTGRQCDEAGRCSPLASGAAPVAAAPVAAAGGESGRSECMQAQRSACQQECSGKQQREAASCVSQCLQKACPDDPASTGGDASGTAETAQAAPSCDDCKSQCKQRCGSLRGVRQSRCESECEPRCASACG
jgi:hypothetical protein